MKRQNRGPVSIKGATRAVLHTIIVSILFAFGCGGASDEGDTATRYPTGISEDIEQQLKYDARVDSFEADGENLVVNVNDEWMNSPPGMQERSVGQWYSLWHSNHSGGVTVHYGGNKVASWTGKDGYRPVTKASSDEPGSET